jgi:hypothetical protein
MTKDQQTKVIKLAFNGIECATKKSSAFRDAFCEYQDAVKSMEVGNLKVDLYKRDNDSAEKDTYIGTWRMHKIPYMFAEAAEKVTMVKISSLDD